MKNLLIVFFIYLSLGTLKSQSLQYSYDNCGNRTSRKIYCNGCQRTMATTPGPEEKVDAMKIAMENGISVFPNPTSNDVMSLKINNYINEENSMYSIIDLQGKVLISKQLNSETEQINLSGISSGIYYLKVNKGKSELFYKIIKE